MLTAARAKKLEGSLFEGHPAWHGLGTVAGVTYRGPDATCITSDEFAVHTAVVDNAAVALSRASALSDDGRRVLRRPLYDPGAIYSKFVAP